MQMGTTRLPITTTVKTTTLPITVRWTISPNKILRIKCHVTIWEALIIRWVLIPVCRWLPLHIRKISIRDIRRTVVWTIRIKWFNYSQRNFPLNRQRFCGGILIDETRQCQRYTGCSRINWLEIWIHTLENNSYRGMSGFNSLSDEIFHFLMHHWGRLK